MNFEIQNSNTTQPTHTHVPTVTVILFNLASRGDSRSPRSFQPWSRLLARLGLRATPVASFPFLLSAKNPWWRTWSRGDFFRFHRWRNRWLSTHGGGRMEEEVSVWLSVWITSTRLVETRLKSAPTPLCAAVPSTSYLLGVFTFLEILKIRF